MANFSGTNTTAVDGFSESKPVASSVSSLTYNRLYSILENYIVNVTETRPGYLTGRRPTQGQQFPRGIYNK